nr:DUF433 domain-containing protein [uncultured Rhodopila sp.]
MSRVEVVCELDVMSGDPGISGTRILPETIAANLRTGYHIDLIFRACPILPDEAIEAAVR